MPQARKKITYMLSKATAKDVTDDDCDDDDASDDTSGKNIKRK